MISVCIATYNGEKYIEAQLFSILKQIGLNDEVIISDDGSIDLTLDIIRNISDSRIKMFANNSHDYTKNFENAIRHASGDVIILSDQDDVWFDNKVRDIEYALKTSDFVAHDALFVDENLFPTGETLFLIRGGKSGFFQNLVRSQYLGACIAFKSVMIPKILPFPKNSKLCPHDLWISLIAEFYFNTEVINRPLIYYRRHSNNVSNGGLYSNTTFFFKFKFRCYTFFNILFRF